MDRQKKISELRSEIAKLEAEEARQAALPEDKRLAEALHELLCTWNHTDGCSWYYEVSSTYPTPTWRSWTHGEYLKRAKNVMASLPGMNSDDIVKVVKAIKGA